MIQSRATAVHRTSPRLGRLFQVLWLLTAFLVIAAGLAMLVLPGPALIVIPIGVAMLAARFRWAQRLLTATIEHGVTAHRRLSKASLGVRMAVWLAGAAVAGCVAWLVLR